VIKFFGDEQTLKTYIGVKDELTDHEKVEHLWTYHQEHETEQTVK